MVSLVDGGHPDHSFLTEVRRKVVKILYDHQIFSTQIYGGASRYFYELINHLQKDQEINVELSLRYSNNHYVESATFSRHKKFFWGINVRGSYRILRVLNRQKTKVLLQKQSFDVFHPTYYDPYFLDYIGSKQFVLTIYDMIHEIFPHTFSDKGRTAQDKRLLAYKSKKIIAISENTKRDIIRFYGIDDDKIDVIYLANSLSKTNDKANTLNVPQRYLLFVGDRDGYKNFDRLIKAICPLLVADDTLIIVCVGGGKFSNYEQDMFKQLRMRNRILHCSAYDSNLAYLYENATVFVFPSLYEGFGIPVLEAFACGCPAVLSSRSSLPEVGGDAAVYFDPESELSIKQAIERVIYDETLRHNLKRKGKEQLKKYSWDKTAEKTKAVYRKLI